VGDAARADHGEALRNEIGRPTQGLAQGPGTMQRRERRPLTVDVDGNNRQIVRRGQEAERHHDAVVTLPFLGERDIDRLHDLIDQPLREGGIAGDAGTRDAEPRRVLDRTTVAIGHADGEARHVVHEEIGEVLGRYHDERVRARGEELLAQAAIGGIEGLAQCRIGHVRAPGDTGCVTADTRKHQAHTPATFSFTAVVMA